MIAKIKIVRPDAKCNDKEIPTKEKWLFANKTALNQVQRGLEDAAAGKVKSRGSFAKYVDKDQAK